MADEGNDAEGDDGQGEKGEEEDGGDVTDGAAPWLKEIEAKWSSLSETAPEPEIKTEMEVEADVEGRTRAVRMDS